MSAGRVRPQTRAEVKGEMEMIATVPSELLAEAGGVVKGLVAKDASSAFSRVRLDASGALSVTGSDGGVQIEWRMEGKVDKAGTVTVPGAAFAAFCGALPAGRVLIEGPDRGWVKMSAGGVVFSLAAGDGADFHVMRGPKAESGPGIDIPADVLCDMLRKVRFAVSSDGTRKALEGVNVELKGGLLGMTATDGRRLAHVERECLGVDLAAAVNVTLPTKTVGILHGLLEGMVGRDNGSVGVVFDGAAARFVGDRFCLTAKVVDCVYPD